MSNEIWVLGATGRVGIGVARKLGEAGLPLVLSGRDRARLETAVSGIAGGPRLAVGPLEAVLAEVARSRPSVVVNTVGPFTRTAGRVAAACPPGTHYVDVANEYEAVRGILDMDREAAATDRALVPGAGFGVLATESVLLHVIQGRPQPTRVRVDALASVASEGGVVGSALASSIVDGAAFGGREVCDGRLVRASIGGRSERLRTPDGELVTSAGIPSAELLAAWRVSGAGSVVAASGLLPAGAMGRLLPVLPAILRIPGVSGLAAARLARISMPARERPRPHSWARARAEWPSGETGEAWLRAEEAMDFTVAAMAEVAVRLARGEGRPGAHTPGALFGPELAVAAGGTFLSGRPAVPGASVR